MDFTGAPLAFRRFAEWLVEQGAVVDEDRVDGAFGNRRIDYLYAGVLRIRISVDRGQWEATVGRVEWSEQFDADLWRSVLDGEDALLVLSSTGEQLSLFRARLRDMARVSGGAHQALLDAAEARWDATRQRGI